MDTPDDSKHKHRAKLERERLTSLINSMADGVIALDTHAKVALTNGAALDILDTNGSIAGKPISSLLNLFDRNNQLIDIRHIIKQTERPTYHTEWLLHYPDGEKINLYVSIAPVRLGYSHHGSDLHGHVMIIRDITREKSLEEERNEFISVVSHELRTPIAIAEGNIGNAEFLADRTGDIQQVKIALKQAHEQVIFLAGLVNDLSTLSRAERGKLELNIEPINAIDLVNELEVAYQKEAQSKGLEIYTDCDPSLELIYSSRLYVKEILQNFVTNAIKYTQQGSITIGARRKSGGVEFSINDTGIGISKADQEKVFDKFFRSEDFRTRQNNGTGLGLYVTVKLARMLNADIDLESEINKGSTFKVFIPNLQ